MDRRTQRRRQQAASSRSPAPRQSPEKAITPAIQPIPSYACEADLVPGLATFATAELQRRLGPAITALRVVRPGTITFRYAGDLAALTRFRTILAIYLVQQFAVPRPRALLGDAHFRVIIRLINAIRAIAPAGSYRTLYLSAAGSDSTILARLKHELAQQTTLQISAPDAHEGDLLLRLRRAPTGNGWELLARITPRPLSARPWRVQNLEGALNATVAQVMATLTDPNADDYFLNLACGSGTLLIERASCGAARQIIGVDLNPAALAIAQANIAAAGYAPRITLRREDVRALSLPTASISAICADLPFGHLVGSHDENLTLYPAILAEAARVARPDAPCIVLTHEIRLMTSLLETSDAWALEQTNRVTVGGLRPCIFVLRRR